MQTRCNSRATAARADALPPSTNGAISMTGSVPTACRDAAMLSLQRGAAEVAGFVAELVGDPEELVVFREPVGARERAGLDLAAVCRHSEIGDRRVLGLARAMREHGGVAGALRGIDRLERLRQRADLVELHQERVRDPRFDAALEPRLVGDEEIVADELELLP